MIESGVSFHIGEFYWLCVYVMFLLPTDDNMCSALELYVSLQIVCLYNVYLCSLERSLYLQGVNYICLLRLYVFIALCAGDLFCVLSGFMCIQLYAYSLLCLCIMLYIPYACIFVSICNMYLCIYVSMYVFMYV